MGYKIFVSYKFNDATVYPLKSYYEELNHSTTARSYVDELEKLFDKSNDIYKGESDGEDLSYLSEDEIWERLKDRIFDSSVTIVLISLNMKVPYVTESSQWIPWEISFSLKETTRNDKTSHSNAILGIILPDKNNEYFYMKNFCGNYYCNTHCIEYNSQKLFSIINKNLWNKLNPQKVMCDRFGSASVGDCSYITMATWDEFNQKPFVYINEAVRRKENIVDYNICKDV